MNSKEIFLARLSYLGLGLVMLLFGLLGTTSWLLSPAAAQAQSQVSQTNDTTLTPTVTPTLTPIVTPTPWEADLYIEQRDTPEPVNVGEMLTYTIKVKNLGPATATNVTLLDDFPDGVQFVSATASQGSCSAPTDNQFTCALGSLAKDESATVTLIVRPQERGEITNTVNVSNAVPDPNLGNNSHLEDTIVGPNGVTLISVAPSFGWNDVESYVHIYGDAFTEPLTVSLRTTPLTVTEVLTDRLLAIVPAGMTPGLYDLTVETAKGAATKEAAYTVLEATDVDDLTSFPEWLWSEPRTMRVGYANSGVGLNVQRVGGRRLLEEQHGNGVTVEFVLKLESGDVVLGRSQTPAIGPTFVESTGKVIWEPEEAGEYLICAIIDPDDDILERDGEEPNGAESNNEICRTVTVLEQVLDLVRPVVNDDFQINDGASTTSAVTVTLDVTAEDPPPNPRSGLDALCFIEFEYILGASWNPLQRCDWIPYATAYQDYPWRLTESPGIHYMRVWAVDKAGNISLDSRIEQINLVPSQQVASLAEGELDFYRILVQAGQTLSVTLSPESGDADLYIWGAGNNPPWYSNKPTGTESLALPMTETGMYQIEVHGYTDAEYRLSFEVTDVPSEPLRASQGGSDKPLPTAPSVPLEDIPDDNLYLDPPLPNLNTYIYLPITVLNK